MWIDEDLPNEVIDRIEPLCLEGDSLCETHPMQAITKYREAFEVLPNPKEQWLAGTWILTAIGDTAYLAGNLPLARDTFREIGVSYLGWADNQFIRLRRGQVAFDSGELQVAANELACAFMLGGYEILDSVDDRYSKFALGKLLPPVPPIKHRLAAFHLKPEKPWWRIW